MSYADLAERLTLRPLERPVECAGRASQFSARWSQTMGLLDRELRVLRAANAVLEIDFREQDFRLDGLPRAGRSAQSPGIVLSFTATAVPGKPALRYEVGTYRHWEDNLRAVALGLQALRAVDRYGVTKRGEQYAGWRQLEAGSGVGEGDPARGRHLIDEAEGNIKTALFLAHPDHGGEPEDFRDVIAARDAA